MLVILNLIDISSVNYRKLSELRTWYTKVLEIKYF